MSRDPLWMEGNEVDDELIGEPSDFFNEEDDGVDPDRLHDGFYDD